MIFALFLLLAKYFKESQLQDWVYSEQPQAAGFLAGLDTLQSLQEK